MLRPELLLIDGDYSAVDLTIYNILSTLDYTSASIEVKAGADANSYKYRYYPLGQTPGLFTLSNSSTISLSGLTPGSTYGFEVKAYEMSGGIGMFGDTYYTYIVMPTTSKAGTVIQTVPSVTPVGIISSTEENPVIDTTSSVADAVTVYPGQPTRSIFQLSNNKKDKSKYTTAQKTFSKIDTSKNYYAFGTTMFFKSSGDTTLNSGGFMFFADSLCQTGYYISIQSSDSADLNKQNPFRILKIKKNQITQIKDSQEATSSKFGAIYGGESYKIDVLVKTTSTYVDIVAYINGFKISARDVTDSSENEADYPNVILPKTNKLGLVCAFGTCFFDYVYGMNISALDFDHKKIFNIYDGQYSNAFLSSAFGEKLISNPTEDPSNADVDEFGAVAREIKYYNFKYKDAAYPLYATTGANTLIKILGQRFTTFGAELYVLNNGGTYVPLADEKSNSLWVVGKSVSKAGYVEYLDDQAGKFAAPAPVIFESRWIQKNSDAVALAEWIKGTWSKKQMIVEFTAFGNPLISVGDIIKVNYPYNDLDGSSGSTEKYLVTNVGQQYSEGLVTSIVCRTL